MACTHVRHCDDAVSFKNIYIYMRYEIGSGFKRLVAYAKCNHVSHDRGGRVLFSVL
jgi:hypothetical protein